MISKRKPSIIGSLHKLGPITVVSIVFPLFLDELEVEALFERELAKMYDPNNPEDDMVEKVSVYLLSSC